MYTLNTTRSKMENVFNILLAYPFLNALPEMRMNKPMPFVVCHLFFQCANYIRILSSFFFPHLKLYMLMKQCSRNTNGYRLFYPMKSNTYFIPSGLVRHYIE